MLVVSIDYYVASHAALARLPASMGVCERGGCYKYYLLVKSLTRPPGTGSAGVTGLVQHAVCICLRECRPRMGGSLRRLYVRVEVEA